MTDDILKVKYGREEFLPETRDENTLYFVTDTKKIFRGSVDYTGEISKISVAYSGETGTVTIYKKDGSYSTFTILDSSTILKIIELFNGTINLAQKPGLVKLSDAINSANDVTKGIAATPKAIHTGMTSALQAAKAYTDTKVAESLAAIDGTTIKGAVGKRSGDLYMPFIISDDPSINNVYFEDLTNYKAGWIFWVSHTMLMNLPNLGSAVDVEPGDVLFAISDYVPKDMPDGKDDWIVIQANIINALTYKTKLKKGQLVRGAGESTVEPLASSVSDEGKVLTVNSAGEPEWMGLPVDENTTYEFTDGYTGEFFVTPSGGPRQTIKIGKPTAAGTADVAKQFIYKFPDGTSENRDFGEVAGMPLVRVLNKTTGTRENPVSAKAVYDALYVPYVEIVESLNNLSDGINLLTDALTWKSFEQES